MIVWEGMRILRKYGLVVALGIVALVEGAYIFTQQKTPADSLPPQSNNSASVRENISHPVIPITVDESDRLTLSAKSQEFVGTQIPYPVYQPNVPASITEEVYLPVIPNAVEPPTPNQPMPFNGSSEFVSKDDSPENPNGDDCLIVSEGKSYNDGRIAFIGGENIEFDNGTFSYFNEKK